MAAAPHDHRHGVLLLDLDGTLVDSMADLAGSLNELRGELGRGPIPGDRVKAMVGDGVAKLVERGLAHNGEPAPKAGTMAALVKRFVEIYETRLTLETRPYPGVPETLARLRQDGWRLALCTNKPEAASRLILEALDLSLHFEMVSGGDSFAERKPAAGHLLDTLAAMTAGSTPAIMVGDGPNDLLAGRNAGLPVVLVSYGYSKIPVETLGADAVIDRFAALPRALSRLMTYTKSR